MFAKVGKAGLATAAVVAGILVGGADPASAAPSNCHTEVSGNLGFAWCGAGSGQFRAKVSCIREVDGRRYTVTGPWVSPGNSSTRRCTGEDYLASVAVEKR